MRGDAVVGPAIEIGRGAGREAGGPPNPFPSSGPGDDESEAPPAMESSANLKALQL
jgi:hypothetical protein